MGSSQKSKINQSLSAFAKSAKSTKYLLIIFVIFGSGCKTSPPSLKTSSKEISFPAPGLRLTSVGKHKAPRFSADGRVLYFLAKHPGLRSGWQIYEMDLSSFRERRVTYQDGDIEALDVCPDGTKILYSSTTDELKEHPLALGSRQTDERFPPTDLYVSDPRGLQITRLTENLGYQGQGVWSSNTELLFLQKEAEKKLEFWSYDLSQGKTTSLIRQPDFDIKTLALGSTRDHHVYSIVNGTKDSVVVSDPKKVQTFSLSRGKVQSLEILRSNSPKGPSRVLLSIFDSDRFISTVFVWDPEKNCQWKLLEQLGRLSDATADRALEQLVLVVQQEEDAQLYLRDFPTLTSSCENSEFMVQESSVSRAPAADLRSNLKIQLNCWDKVPSIQSCQIPW